MRWFDNVPDSALGRGYGMHDCGRDIGREVACDGHIRRPYYSRASQLRPRYHQDNQGAGPSVNLVYFQFPIKVASRRSSIAQQGAVNCRRYRYRQ